MSTIRFWWEVAGILFLFTMASVGSLRLVHGWAWRSWAMIAGALVPSLGLFMVTVILVVAL